jgi:hypothetical protein
MLIDHGESHLSAALGGQVLQDGFEFELPIIGACIGGQCLFSKDNLLPESSK